MTKTCNTTNCMEPSCRATRRRKSGEPDGAHHHQTLAAGIIIDSAEHCIVTATNDAIGTGGDTTRPVIITLESVHGGCCLPVVDVDKKRKSCNNNDDVPGSTTPRNVKQKDDDGLTRFLELECELRFSGSEIPLYCFTTTEDDVSDLESNDQEFCNEQQCTILSFPQRLLKLLEQETEAPDVGREATIAWLATGDAFEILDTVRLTSCVLPKYFKRCKYESFVRKLYRWGFKRSQTKNSTTGSAIFSHENFRRDDDQNTCLKMKPCTNNKVNREMLSRVDNNESPALLASPLRSDHHRDVDIVDLATNGISRPYDRGSAIPPTTRIGISPSSTNDTNVDVSLFVSDTGRFSHSPQSF